MNLHVGQPLNHSFSSKTRTARFHSEVTGLKLWLWSGVWPKIQKRQSIGILGTQNLPHQSGTVGHCSLGLLTILKLTHLHPRLGISTAAAAAGGSAILSASSDPAQAAAVVAKADAVVLVLNGYREGESHDRQILNFPDDQQTLLSAVAKSAGDKDLIVLLISGGAIDSSSALDVADAVIAMYSGGMEAGSAIADVLYGSVNPSGTLAATVYRQSWTNVSDFLSMALRAPPGRGHRYLTESATTNHVLFPFGFGLSYSTWEASIFSVSPNTVSKAAILSGQTVTVQVEVSNTGGPMGSRVTYILLSRENAVAEEEWPAQWLPVQGFAKVHGVNASTSMKIDLKIGATDVSRWNQHQSEFQVAPGTYSVRVRDDIRSQSQTLTITP